MPPIPPPSLVIAGQLRRQYLLPFQGRPQIDSPGGNLLYAAGGARIWADSVAILARVGEDYPHDWLRTFRAQGLDVQGVKILPHAMELRSFLAYTDQISPQRTNPVSHFARLGLPFPKSLLGYQPESDAHQDSRTSQRPDSPKLNDVPSAYLQTRVAHLAPLDFLTHTQLAPAFRHAGAMAVCMDPSAGYMNGIFMNELRSLLQGVTAFLPSEEELRNLFWGRTTDLWEMAETLGSFGCEIVVVKRGARGQFVYEHASKRKWEIPAYPCQVYDLTGAGDSFCGGFATGFLTTQDPLQASLYGNIAASITVEGIGPFYPLESLPGLAQARLFSLSNIVKQI